jgi:light-independent protochlorophyllide reductase subunit B
LNIPCAVISAPIHIQNFSLGYRPFLGYEGTNQISDLIYNCFTLGMEDHLLEIFGGHDTTINIDITSTSIGWTDQALYELSQIPGFVRYRVRQNTEHFAQQNNISEISVETLYQAKEYFATHGSV